MTDHDTPKFREGPPRGDDMQTFATQINSGVLARITPPGLERATSSSAGFADATSPEGAGVNGTQPAESQRSPIGAGERFVKPSGSAGHPARNTFLALSGIASAITAIILVGTNLLGINSANSGIAAGPAVSAAPLPVDENPAASPIPKTGRSGYPLVSSMTSSSGAVALVRQSVQDFFPEALIHGTVESLGDECIGLLEGDTFVLAVWPAGTTFLPRNAGLNIPGYGDLPFGSVIEAGGGYGDIAGSNFAGSLPAGCDSGDLATINDYPN